MEPNYQDPAKEPTYRSSTKSIPSYRSVLKPEKKGFGLPGSFLKFFALIMMTAYDFAVVIIQNGKLYGYSELYYHMAIATEEGQWWLRLHDALIITGQFSFPFFAYLLVEGVIHTSDFWKYFRRVLIFALLSEVPYDLCFFNETYDLTRQNPMFTLAIGLLCMYFMQQFHRRSILKWFSVAVCCALAYAVKSDFGLFGVLGIALMYNFRKEKTLRILSGIATTALLSLDLYGIGALCYLLILLYNGDRGHLSMKWFYYLYYPLHLTVFYLMIYIGATLTA